MLQRSEALRTDNPIWPLFSAVVKPGHLDKHARAWTTEGEIYAGEFSSHP